MISNTTLFSINFEWSDLIGATHIPVVPRFVALSFPRPFFEGRGVGRHETKSDKVSNHYIVTIDKKKHNLHMIVF